jgi:hypothetical protein
MGAQTTELSGGAGSQVEGETPSTSLGGLPNALRNSANNLLHTGRDTIDRWGPSERTREQVKTNITTFATENPKLAAFVLSQAAFSGIPLVLFCVTAVTTFVFALLTSAIVAVLSALLFTTSCLGLALVILLPTLFLTTLAGTTVFLFATGVYCVVRLFSDKDVSGLRPGIENGVLKGGDIEDKQPALGSGKPAPAGCSRLPNWRNGRLESEEEA